ncbi:MAG TPA: type II secretion system protein [Planctomycetota bacterium]|nr:type II secretion system protein [Planctomycetota bacterium]
MRKSRGFTILEMMVVVTIALVIMTIIISVFQVSTRTVKSVERKLAVYEAARNILDIVHAQVMMAVVNERSEQFSIKSLNYTNTPGFPVKVANPDVTARYGRTLRREADALQYGVLNAGCSIWRDWRPDLPGSYVHAVGYIGMYHTHPGAYKASIRSTLAYPKRDDYDGSGYIMTGVWNVPRPVGELREEMLNDVTQIELMNVLTSTNHESWEAWENNGMWGPQVTPYDPIHHFFAPGNEPKYTIPIYGDIGRKNQARMSGIKLMDLDFAYWDEQEKTFKDPPDNSVIYFAPAPKAIRATITVCDTERRSTVTLSRVIHLHIGANPATSSWIKSDDGDYAVPLPSNQIKNVLTLEPTLTEIN